MKSCNLLEDLNFIGAFEKENEVSYTFRFNLIANDSDVKTNFQKVIEFFSKNKIKYSIILPPPNTTGVSHLRPARDATTQAVMIRYKRLKGFNTL